MFTVNLIKIKTNLEKLYGILCNFIVHLIGILVFEALGIVLSDFDVRRIKISLFGNLLLSELVVLLFSLIIL